jgi:uncharacterized protein (DUF952 family)
VRLFHITSRAEWDTAQATGEYRPQGFAREGFVHCSYAEQVIRTANKFYRGMHGLVLLEIDPARLTCAVVEENLEGGSELFPHVYGPLPVAATTGAHVLIPGEDGTFHDLGMPWRAGRA